MFHHLASSEQCSRPNVRGLVYALLVIAFITFASPLARATVLFSENFDDATEGQTWYSYPGWRATASVANPAVIQTIHGQKMGTLAYSGTTLEAPLPEEYSLATHGYRLSFQVSGPLNRPLVIAFGDANNDRLGMELGYAGSLYGLGGTYLTQFQGYGQRIHYNPDTGDYGGYYSLDTAPPGFSSTALYDAKIDINGTSAPLEIGGSLLAAGKVRITFNEGNVGGMATYTVLFDIPEAFDGLSTLQIGKTASGGAVWSIGSFELTSYAAIPEPSSLAAFVAGGLLLGFALRQRRI